MSGYNIINSLKLWMCNIQFLQCIHGLAHMHIFNQSAGGLTAGFRTSLMLQPFEIFSKCLRSLGLGYLDGMTYFKYLCHKGYGLEHPLVRPTS